MALPPGLNPKQVTLGIASFADGSLASGRATISMPVNVVHTPSNRPIFSSDMTLPFVDGAVSFNLLPTDAPGLNNVSWAYKLKVEISGATVQPEVIYFVLPTAGPDVVDLDGLVTVPSSAGMPISVPMVTSVNGQTGDVTVAGGTGGSVTDATTTAKGVVQLAGDLGGTAASPTVPGLAAKVNSSTYTQGIVDAKARANHTGTQAATTITGLATVATSGLASDLTGTLTDAQIPAAIARDAEVTAAVATRLPIFTPSTAYTAGQYILNPQGQVVSSLATFTSGASYSSADWALNSGTVYPTQRPMVPPSKVISRFPSGHGWTGGTDDTATKLFTDRTLKGVSLGTAASTYLTSPAVTVDASGSIFRMIFKVDDPTRLSQITILVTTGAGNSFQGNVQYNLIANEWCVATISRSQFTVAAGTPTWAGVTKFDVRFKDNGGSNPVTIWLAALELVPDQSAVYPNGVFVLEADDGYASQFTQMKPVTDGLGIPVTMNLIIDRIAGGANGFTVADLLNAQKYSGWSMSCHANSQAFHNTAGAGATAVTAHADFAAEKQWLHDNGFHSGADHYALCPGTGSPVAEGPVMDQLRADFTSVRVNSGFYETVIPGDRHKLRSILFSGNSNANLQSNIDAVAGAGGMLIFTVHEVIAGATNGTASSLPAIAAANLTTVLQYAASKGMAFRTRADVMALR